jgi:hypothetical protein
MATMREGGRGDRGGWSNATKRDPLTQKMARTGRAGEAYDAGPGREGLPSARDMDRPSTPCGTFGRTGGRGSIDAGIRKIQD